MNTATFRALLAVLAAGFAAAFVIQHRRQFPDDGAGLGNLPRALRDQPAGQVGACIPNGLRAGLIEQIDQLHGVCRHYPAFEVGVMSVIPHLVLPKPYRRPA